MRGQYNLSDYNLPEVRVKLCESGCLYSAEPVSSPYAAVMLLAKELQSLDREELLVLNLNTKNKVINYHLVSMGSIDKSLAPVASLVKTGILSNASSFIMMHNHPSGEPRPSNEDIAVTKKMLLVGKLLEMPLVDHVIVGGGTGNIYSFRENYPDIFADMRLDLGAVENGLPGLQNRGKRKLAANTAPV